LLPAGVIVKTYGKQTLQPGDGSSHFPDLWDLTICQAARQAIGCDLRVRYRVDLSGVTVPGPGPYLWTEVGIHEEGEPDFNPSGHGGWMVSYLVNPGSDPAKFDLTDKHSAQSAGGLGEASYDVHDCTSPVVTTPVGTSNSFGFWYDRDGADAAHTSHPLAGDGKTYNTKGVYKIELCYRATGLTSGTLCHRVNGVEPGFFTATGTKMPDIYPAGLSVGGEMDDMVVFVGFGNGGGQGTVVVDNVEVVGCPRP
jgi:hypothetical protein